MSERMVDPIVSRRSLLLGAAGIVAAAELAACSRSSATNSGEAAGTSPGLVVARGVAREAPVSSAPTATVTASIGTFGHALAAATVRPGVNWVTSPLSIACAFAMARAGAAKTTASQLDATFGYPGTGRDEAFNAITRQLVTTDVPPKPSGVAPSHSPGDRPAPPIVCLGNALFPQHGFPIGEAFLRTLAAQYGAGVRPVDFAQPGAAAAINDWVAQLTAGRIKKLFDQLDPSTLLVLANTVYLKASWADMLPDALAPDASFRTAAGPVMVPTFHLTGNMRYATGDGFEAVEVPYASSDLAMRIVLPPAGRAPLDMLAPATMSTVASALASTQLHVFLPRWDFASDLDLRQVLMGMGLTVPFLDQADFSGIHPGLYIDQAVHRANITVDEWGTEAAAVTGLAMDMRAGAPAPMTMRVDRPFAFAIVGGPSRVPLFMGIVADPSVH
jgi:serpin B